ncbi:hypothetical protein [Streptomyces sp.]|uniref:hypothetical protein n=1 Tax=Streptomyces sp. TaxID=1931 RepID=UPI002D4C0913|nr:hypothetical protein [Streptomyces sp.]HZF89969.1 hypothetical protein [Streptomyces sp.]
MDKLKKAAAVAVMVGGMALGGGVAHAGDGHDYKDAGDVIIGNLQAVECNQEFDGGVAFVPAQVTVTGDNTQVIGNFCTVVGPVED